MLDRLITLPAGRRAKWLVLAVWFAAAFGVVAADLPGRFAEAEQNESTSFLPESAESTEALLVTERLRGGDTAPAVVVYRRPGGLTPADRRLIREDLRELNQASRRFANTSPFRGPVLSPDRTTAILQSVVRGTGESGDILDPVGAYREIVDGRGGLQAAVTGPAGISADAIEIFEGINGPLVAAAAGLVLVLLVLIYRSPIFWIFPFMAVLLGELASRGFGWGLTEAGVTVNGQSSALLSILVLGAGTDYALLLVARYREELRRREDRHEAMRLALRSAGPAIFASGMTVAAALLTLSLAQVNGTAGLGPIGAMGIGVAVLVMLTFLPALLVAVGRRPFWPFVPHPGDEGPDETHGGWRRLGDAIARRPRRVWIGTTIGLGIMALGLLNFSTGLTQGNSFTDEVESIEGQQLVAQAFPSGQAAPTDIVVPPGVDPQAVARAAETVPGVADVLPEPVAGRPGGFLQLAAVLRPDPYSPEGFAVIPRLREAVHDVAPGVLVGGPTAVEQDLREAGAEDTRLLIPIALAVVFLILAALLRAVLVSVLLIATVVLSFAAALGVGSIVFDVVFGFPGSDASLPLIAFIFLVALGVDYNIFLMARVREETLAHGTRHGMVRGLAVTGGVITSAGIVLAGTFSVLATLPLVFLVETGFVVAFGVLLDTAIVRSVLVPALVLDIGPPVWWPSRLRYAEEDDAS